MTERKIYGAGFGPYLYDDTDLVGDPDDEFDNFTAHASESNGGHIIAFADFLDTDQSHGLKLYWNENDSGHRELALLVSGGNRSLTIESDAIVSQDYSVDGSPQFASPTISGTIRATTASYRRYYHVLISSANPGASGATWVPADGNTIGGWRLTAAGHTLTAQVDMHSDWDGVTNPILEVTFEINTASVLNDTVDLRAIFYYKTLTQIVTRTQTVEVATNVGVGGVKAQYTMFKVNLPLDADIGGGNNLTNADIIRFRLNLETDTSEVDDVIINAITFYYPTTHVGTESTDV